MTDDATPAPEADEGNTLWAEAVAAANGEPTPEPEKRKDAAPEAAPDPEATQQDPWANAPEALRLERETLKRERDDLEHKWHSDRARLPAMTRKINELQAAIDAKSAPAPADIKARIASLKEDFPEMGEAMDDVFSAFDQRIAASEAAQAARETAAIERRTAQIEAEISAAHEDWRPLLKARGDEFFAWAEDQPKRIREMVERNKDEFSDAREVSEAISLFKQHIGTITPPAPTPTQNDPDKRRARQLAASSSPAPSSRAAAAEPSPTDAEGIWKASVAKARKRYG